ncbi:MAG: phosphate/phosphite/phosphonate ABC transporter substrate-binding protein [candidate division NC10 bacterium]|nr:phosphate/phosphite/phosphonate ABC transporter substrate-binding protein [candidate division NC10 bacterium]
MPGRRARWTLAVCLLAGTVALTAGNGGVAQGATGITLALTPSKDPTLLQEAGTALAQELGKRLDLPIKLYVAADYAGVIEALRNGTVDLAFVHPVAYVLASREARARILVKSIRGGSATYTARFFVLKEGGPRTLDDLRGKTIAFVDPASTSGYIYPMVFLMKRGLVKGKDPKTFFKDAVFSGAHDAVLHAVLRRQVDVAVSYPHAPDTLDAAHPQRRGLRPGGPGAGSRPAGEGRPVVAQRSRRPAAPEAPLRGGRAGRGGRCRLRPGARGGGPLGTGSAEALTKNKKRSGVRGFDGSVVPEPPGPTAPRWKSTAVAWVPRTPEPPNAL